MSMNQNTILSFLSNPKNKVMLDTSYTNAFGKTPGRIAKLLRSEPDQISGGFGMVGDKVKDRAHTNALRALVREKRVHLKVDMTGEHPMVIAIKKSLRGRPPKNATESEPVETPRVKRKYTRRTDIVSPSPEQAPTIQAQIDSIQNDQGAPSIQEQIDSLKAQISSIPVPEEVAGDKTT